MNNSKDITSLFCASISHNLKTECLWNSRVKCFQRKGTAVGVFDFYIWKKQRGRSTGSPYTHKGVEGPVSSLSQEREGPWKATLEKGFFSMCSSYFIKACFEGVLKLCSIPCSKAMYTFSDFYSTQALSEKSFRASLVVQWLRICLLMQGTRVRALVWEDPTCRGATRPVSRNYWACMSGACAPQQERPRWWEARAPRWRVAPACHNWRKPSHRNEDPTQPKKLIN